MTRRFYTIALALMSCMAIVPSCKEESDIEEVSLNVSESELLFGREASEKTISVSSSATSWSYLSPQEFSWFTLSQEGNSLKVKVEENTLGKERMGVVAISAGGIQRRVIIRQSAADAVIESEVSALELPVTGGTRTFAFTSNAQGVKAELGDEAAAAWLSIDKVTDKAITITAKANPDKGARTAKVLLTLGTTTHEVAISQAGTISYMLPMMTDQAVKDIEVIHFEQDRGSILLQAPTEQGYTHYRFRTTNPLLHTVEYTYYGQAPTFNAAEIASDDIPAFFEVKTDADTQKESYALNLDFQNYLSGLGYKQTGSVLKGDVPSFSFEKDGSPYELLANYHKDARLVTIVLRFTGRQKQSYATFTHLPGAPLWEKIGSPLILDEEGKNLALGHTRAEIAAYEKEMGGEIEPHEHGNAGQYDRYYTKNGKKIDDEVMRGYFFTYEGEALVPPGSAQIGRAEGAQILVPDLHKAFYTDDLNKLHLTKELNQLMRNNGYQLGDAASSGYYLYFNTNLNQVYAFLPAQIGENWYLDVQMQKMDLSSLAGGEASYMHYRNYPRYLQELKKRHQALQQIVKRLQLRRPTRVR